MPDEPKPDAAPPMLSSICPGDLGLKAAFWTDTRRAAFTFKPILGWVTVMNHFFRLEARDQDFHPVVLNEFGHPVLAPLIKGYAWVFEKGVSHERAKQLWDEWAKLEEDRPRMVPAFGRGGN
jgi:hypothetical protein